MRKKIESTITPFSGQVVSRYVRDQVTNSICLLVSKELREIIEFRKGSESNWIDDLEGLIRELKDEKRETYM